MYQFTLKYSQKKVVGKYPTISPLTHLPPKILDETPSDSIKSMNSKSTNVKIDANKTGKTKELTESKFTQFFVKLKACWAILFFIIIFFFVFWIMSTLWNRLFS